MVSYSATRSNGSDDANTLEMLKLSSDVSPSCYMGKAFFFGSNKRVGLSVHLAAVIDWGNPPVKATYI